MEAEYNPPWRLLPEWSIILLQHVGAVNDVRPHIRVIMAYCKDENVCITAEGVDDQFLWNRLWHKAQEIENDE